MYLVLNNKSPFYQLIYLKDGKRTSTSTGTSNKIEAEKFLRLFDPTLIKNLCAEKHSIKISEFYIEYKHFVTNNFSVKYLKKAVHPSFSQFQNFIPDIPLEQVSSKIIDQFISSVAAKSKFSASLYFRSLKAAFNKAVTWEYISENPFNKIKAPKVSKTYPAFIDFNELQLIISNTAKPFLIPLFYTAFYTGMRLGEILNMKYSWIDLSQNIITTKISNGFSTKSKKERIIPMNDHVQQIINRKLISLNGSSREGYIFQNPNGIKYNEDFISKQFKKIVHKADLSDEIHFHSLRHSFASILVQRGVSLYVVKELLGHEDIKTTQVYSHLTQVSLSNAVNLL